MDKNQVYYPLDNSPYKIVMLFLCINTLLSVMSINHMTANLRVGVEVMLTIIISLLSFLIAIRLQNYTPTWEVRTLLLAVVQFARLLILPSLHGGSTQLLVQIMLVFSGILLLLAAYLSYQHQKQRNAYIEEKVRSYGGRK